MTNLRVGMKVVCVKEHDPDIRREMASFGVAAPVLRHVYTIRAVRSICGGPDVLLEEIVNPVLQYNDGLRTEQGFSVDRFRPVTERKTDISIFTAMLHTQRVRVPS